MDSIMERKIDELFSLWQRGLCPGGQVKVRKDGELIYDKCFGYASLEHELLITGDTVFHVASVSKQVTVMCALLLHEDGKINIDDDIRKHISDLILFNEPVSIRNMMNNVSGIRDQWELHILHGTRIDDTITQEDAKALIATQTVLNFEPLSEYMYSNSNFTLLAEIVERVSGKTLNEFAAERIFRPLQMSSTCFKDRYWNIVANRADSYYDNGTEYMHNVLNYGSYGATSLNTTASDFMKWMGNYKNPVICKKETLELMFERPVLKDGKLIQYAGGLSIYDYKCHKLIEHGGADAAFRSQILHFPDDDLDIIIFSNTQNLSPSVIAKKIADFVLGIKEENTASLPEFYYEDFDEADAVGKYYSGPGVPFCEEIYAKDGQLFMTGGYDGYGDRSLMHVKGNYFKAGSYGFYLGKKAGIDIGGFSASLTKWEGKAEKRGVLIGFVGRYESTEIDAVYTVSEENGYLYVSHIRKGKTDLLKIDRDQYIAGGSFGCSVTFTRGSDGKVAGCVISTGRVKNVAFSKVDRETV